MWCSTLFFKPLQGFPDLNKKGFQRYLGRKETILVIIIVLLSQNVFSPFNPFPNKPWFLHVCMPSLLKTLWEKEKLLIMSNFSFSHSVFSPFSELSAIFIRFEIVVCKLFQFGGVQNLSFGNGLKANFM